MGGLHTGIETVNLSAASKMVSEYSGMMLQKHKVGPLGSPLGSCLP